MLPLFKAIPSNALKFTPLEFETQPLQTIFPAQSWLKFTPLEFETGANFKKRFWYFLLKFTPLEFETL